MSQILPARVPLSVLTVTALLLTGLVLTGLAVPAVAQSAPVTRLTGGSAAEDAVAWSRLTYADGTATTVLVTRDDDFADALTTGPVQGLLDAPLLLTDTEVLSPVTAAEVQRLDAETAIIVGGEAAVSPAVEAELQALGLGTERIMGDDRLQTAVAVLQRFFPDAVEVVLARAFGDTDPTQAFADTIPVGAYSAVVNTPVLLTATDALSDPTATALAGTVERVTIIGGEAAISRAVADQVDAIDNPSSDEDPGITVRRLAGANRFDTAVRVAGDVGYTSAADAGRVILVEGQSADAWTGGLPAAGQAGTDAPVVLANGDLLLQPTFAFLDGTDVPLICGPNVTATACDAAEAAIAGTGQPDTGGGEPGGEDPGPDAAALLAVSPSEERTAAVSMPDPLGGILIPEDDSDDLTYTASGLDPDQAYRVTLVLAENVTVGDDGRATFTDADADGIADPGASEDVALITMAGGQPVEPPSRTVPAGSDDPADPTGVFPEADGTLTVTVDGEGPGSVRPVLYVNQGASTFLEVDGDGRPLEAYGVGGQATYS